MPAARRSLQSSDHTQLCAEVVDLLRQGQPCVLPTETVYGLAMLPSNSQGVARVRELKGRDDGHPFTCHIADRRWLQTMKAIESRQVRRLIERYWPGPLTLVMATSSGETKGVRLPAHEFTRSVIAACDEPLWLTSVNRTGEQPLVEPGAIAETFSDELAMVVDDGPSPLGVASTVVDCTGPGLKVLREGILTTDEVLHSAAELVLFVCTGNTCRSPLAAALAQRATASAFGTEPDQVLAYGFAFASAGVSAIPGMPASEGSHAAAAELQLDLSDHDSQPATPELLRRAKRIYCLGDSHRRALLAEEPEIADRVALLRPDGLDIADPFGGDLATYRRTRDEILAAVTARMRDWLSG